MTLPELLKISRGDAPADVLLTNARVIDLFSGRILPTSVALAGPYIAGLGDDYRADQTIDLQGAYVAPGFIDAHLHLESAMVRPREFARAVVPRGVTTVISNPHEIANVLGHEGILYLLEEGESLPLSILHTVPSCVPATALATSGGEITPTQMQNLRKLPGVVGLGEVMDFAGVVSGDARMMAEIEAFRGLPLDGHAPESTGPSLNAYIAAGITSDHECTTAEEALEKISLGMQILIREGSAARNLEALLPLITAETERRLCFCTDDRQPIDLLSEGSIDHLVRRALTAGVPLATALRLASLNSAEYFRLFDRGAIAPGRRADLIVFRDPADLRPEMVFQRGRLVAQQGELIAPLPPKRPAPESVRRTVHLNTSEIDFSIPAARGSARVIGIVPDQLITRDLRLEPKVVRGEIVADPDRDLLKMAVLERHRDSGQKGVGLVQGVGLRKGAISGTVAHDHHNLVVIGADDESMRTAVRTVAQMQGGLAVALGDQVLARLPLPIAGLISDEPIETVCAGLEELNQAARSLGTSLHDPFMTMSFLALEVIPTLKLTDKGLVDVPSGRIVPLQE